MKRNPISMALVLLLIFLISIGPGNVFAAGTNSAPNERFSNGKYAVEGKVVKVETKQIQSFSGEEANVRIPFSLENVEYYIVSATKKDDSQYFFDYVLTTYNERVVSAPVKYNERDRTLLIKVGTASKDVDLSNTDGERAKANSSITEAPKKDTALENKIQPLAFTTKSGSFQTVWEDPINLNVNSVKDNITFSYDGTTVNYIYGSDNRTWLTASGWYEKSHSINSYYSYLSGKAVNITVATTATYQNDTFCALNTTNVYYNPNAVTGTYIGNISGQVSTNATGGCSSWLHYYNVLDN
ncbi:hypothetical protein ACE3MS_08645 [Paenibacillus dendritiformis]|uniref:Uncharacterized protein n=1 Tax=Paenibacillus ehimensis TaxID=79264 RepID=A0ABT8VFJ4_9BACL|nr:MULTISPECIES: hypothetical protein [Paenibacillus]MBS5910729.1 hypothetical protein [Paenibacillus macerans]MDO3679746.1 hypothetical protein [Paenibacillus ehimensis]MDU5945677.1 hypothetical protein [Paenibacillus macerans]MDU7472307.1 hypothetical protein [Paenibacillus macerans]MEC0136998.1 hypothetical protein [Paenibacillus macerans]